MKKRTDYMNEESDIQTPENTGDTGGVESEGENVSPMVIGVTGAMASGDSMQTSAHSIGLLFEQSVTQQNNDFQLGMTSNSMLTRNLLAHRVNLKGRKLEMENGLAKLLQNSNQFYE